MTDNEVVRYQPQNPADVARAFTASGLFPDLHKTSEAYVKIMAGAEMGIGPMAAMTGINVIRGRPTLSANLLAAQVKRHPRYDYRVVDHSDTTCRIEFTEADRDGRVVIGVSEFTIDDAKRAGVAGGENWRKYPQAMLFARALTQGVRWYAPDVTAGPAYTPEEITLAPEAPEAGPPRPETIEAEAVPEPDADAEPEQRPIDVLAGQLGESDLDTGLLSAVRDYISPPEIAGPDGGRIVYDENVDAALAALAEGPEALGALVGWPGTAEAVA